MARKSKKQSKIIDSGSQVCPNESTSQSHESTIKDNKQTSAESSSQDCLFDMLDYAPFNDNKKSFSEFQKAYDLIDNRAPRVKDPAAKWPDFLKHASRQLFNKSLVEYEAASESTERLNVLRTFEDSIQQFLQKNILPSHHLWGKLILQTIVLSHIREENFETYRRRARKRLWTLSPIQNLPESNLQAIYIEIGNGINKSNDEEVKGDGTVSIRRSTRSVRKNVVQTKENGTSQTQADESTTQPRINEQEVSRPKGNEQESTQLHDPLERMDIDQADKDVSKETSMQTTSQPSVENNSSPTQDGLQKEGTNKKKSSSAKSKKHVVAERSVESDESAKPSVVEDGRRRSNRAMVPPSSANSSHPVSTTTKKGTKKSTKRVYEDSDEEEFEAKIVARGVRKWKSFPADENAFINQWASVVNVPFEAIKIGPDVESICYPCSMDGLSAMDNVEAFIFFGPVSMKRKSPVGDHDSFQIPFISQVSVGPGHAIDSCGSLTFLNIILNCPRILKGCPLTLQKLAQEIDDAPTIKHAWRHFDLSDIGDKIHRAHWNISQQADMTKSTNRFSKATYVKRRKIAEEQEAEEAAAEDSTDIDDVDQPNHFTALMPIGGYIWELDSLETEPIKIEKIPDNTDWKVCAFEYANSLMSTLSLYQRNYAAKLVAIAATV
ncbi:hypothetical protein BGZ46_000338 [Entomortierella lignicola]|nr:hypothetical protein BGZ46_000338 [Entomortierella lignicola]